MLLTGTFFQELRREGGSQFSEAAAGSQALFRSGVPSLNEATGSDGILLLRITRTGSDMPWSRYSSGEVTTLDSFQLSRHPLQRKKKRSQQ